MSTEREVMQTDGTSATMETLATAQERDPAAIKAIRDAKKAKLVRILQRGYAHDRIAVELPDTLYGEWIVNDQFSIHEAETIGFRIDTEYASKQLRGAHDVGDGRAVLGDCIFMVMDAEDKAIHDEIRREAFELANGKPGVERATQKEERDFAAIQRQQGLPVVEESRNRQARKAELEAVLRKRAGATPGVTETGSAPVQEIII